MSDAEDGWIEWLCLQLPREGWVADAEVDRAGRLHCIVSDEPYASGVASYAYEGDQWVPQRLPDGRPLTSFGKLGDGSLVVVGREGACFLWDDDAWRPLEPPAVDLRRVWGSSPDRLCAAGSDFVALLDDDGWRVFKQASGQHGPTRKREIQLADVAGLPGGAIWTVGSDQTHSVILRLEEGGWYGGEGCESWNLHRVRALSPELIVAAGEGGVFQRPHPGEPNERGWVIWKRISSRAPRSFTGTDIASRPEGPIVVGIAVLSEPQQVLLWTPDRWARVRPATAERITAARVVPDGLLAVGTRGALWTTKVDTALGG